MHYFQPLRKNISLICEYSKEQWESPKSNIKWRSHHDHFRLYCLQIQLQTIKVWKDPIFLGTLPHRRSDLCKSAFHDICLKTESCKSCARGWEIVKVCVGYFQCFHEWKKITKPALQQGRFSSPWERFYKTFTQNCFPFVSQHCCLTQWPSLSTSWGSAAFLWEVKKVPPSTVRS